MRKAEERGLDQVRPLTPIGENAPDVNMNVIGHDVRNVRQDHDFHGLENSHHGRHAMPPTGCSGPVTRPAAAWSARFSSYSARYSSVSGGCWPRPSGLLASQGGPWTKGPPTGRSH